MKNTLNAQCFWCKISCARRTFCVKSFLSQMLHCANCSFKVNFCAFKVLSCKTFSLCKFILSKVIFVLYVQRAFGVKLSQCKGLSLTSALRINCLFFKIDILCKDLFLLNKFYRKVPTHCTLTTPSKFFNCLCFSRQVLY